MHRIERNKCGAISQIYFMSTPRTSLEVAKNLDATLSTMKADQYCFLITLDPAGQPQSRMVAATSIEPDMRVWTNNNALQNILGPEHRKRANFLLNSLLEEGPPGL